MTEDRKGKQARVRSGRGNANAAIPDEVESLALREVRRRIKNGEPLPEALRKQIAKLERTLADLTQEASRRIHLHPNRLIRNLLLAIDQDISDAKKLRAARKIKKMVQAGIAKQRRHLVERDLWGMARNHRRTAKKELELLILAAIYGAIEASDEYTADDMVVIESTIRKRVNKLATEGVLGPGWREYKNRISFDEESKEEGHAAAINSEIQKEIQKEIQEKGSKLVKQPKISQIETRLRVRRLLNDANLSLREAKYMALMLRDDDEGGAAIAMGIDPSTGRALKLRAIKKIRKLKK